MSEAPRLLLQKVLIGERTVKVMTKPETSPTGAFKAVNAVFSLFSATRPCSQSRKPID